MQIFESFSAILVNYSTKMHFRMHKDACKLCFYSGKYTKVSMKKSKMTFFCKKIW